MLTFAAALGWTVDSVAVAQPPLSSPFSGESLRKTRITLTVQNQAFSDVLRHLLDSVNLGTQGKAGGAVDDVTRGDRPWSLWLDRRVDPSQTVNVTAAATPVSDTILTVVERVGLAAYPLPGVLLVGRPDWVESTLEHLPTPISKRRVGPTIKSDPEDVISIAWPTGATATEVLAMAVLAPSKLDPDQAPGWLPHDVWKGGNLTEVDRTLAAALILAQFDMRLRRTKSLLPLLARPSTVAANRSTDSGAAVALDFNQKNVNFPSMVSHWTEETLDTSIEFNQSFPGGGAAKAIRQAIRQHSIPASVRGSQGAVNIRTTAANHLVLLKALWSTPMEQSSQVERAETESVFDLKLVNQPVGKVLRQFADAAGKTIRFESGTELASEQLVSLDAVKKTLRQLTDEVAGQVGLEVNWENEQVIISQR